MGKHPAGAEEFRWVNILVELETDTDRTERKSLISEITVHQLCLGTDKYPESDTKYSSRKSTHIDVIHFIVNAQHDFSTLCVPQELHQLK